MRGTPGAGTAASPCRRIRRHEPSAVRPPREPPGRGEQPLPPAAPAQPGRLVPLGRRGARARARARTSRSSSRSATRPATGATSWSASRSRTRDRRADEPRVRQHQGRPRGAAGPRRDLHDGHPDPHRPGRLAELGVPDPGPEAVLRRHLLPARRPLRPARLRRACSRAWPTPGKSRARTSRAGRGDGAAPCAATSRSGRSRRAVPPGAGGRPTRAAASLARRFDRRLGRLRRRAQVPDAVQPLPAARAGGRRIPTAARDAHRDPRPAWPAAASTTSSAAASTATPPTASGRSPTSRRCSTTTACCSRSTPREHARTGDPQAARIARETAAFARARDDLARGRASGAPSTPRPTATRGPTTSGPARSSTPSWARRTPPSWRRSWASTARRSSRGATTCSTCPSRWGRRRRPAHGGGGAAGRGRRRSRRGSSPPAPGASGR